MMRFEKKVAILGGALGALLLLWVAGAIFSPERRAARSQSDSLIAGKAADAASIELGAPRLRLVKESGAWFLEEGGAKLPAQASRVESFIKAVAEINRLKPVARSKDAWKNLELDEATAKPVLIKDGKGVAICDFVMGGYAPAGGDVYVRAAGSDASFAVAGSFAQYVSASRTTWLDLRVLGGSIPETDVEALSLKASLALDGADKPPVSLDYSLRRKAEGWEGIAGTIDPQAVSSLLRAVLAIEGVDIVASPPASAFTPVKGRIEISLGNGVSRVLEVGSDAGDGRFHLRVAGGGYVYAVSAYSLRNAFKAPAELLVK